MTRPSGLRRSPSASSSTSSRTAFAAHVLIAVLSGSPVGHSFAPVPTSNIRARRPLSATLSGGGNSNAGGPKRSLTTWGGGAGAACRVAGERGGGQGELSGEGVEGRGWGWRRGVRRRSSCLKAGDLPDKDKLFNVKNVGSAVPDEDKIQTGGEEDMKRLMYNLDPDSDENGPMYFGTDGMDGPEQIWLKAPEEVRFAECYLAFCVDRDETPEESKNFVFCGVRQQVHMEHLTWARVLARTMEQDSDRQAGILWNRSVLSPSKYKVMGNMMCIRAHSKQAAIDLLESDPFRKAGLYGTVSLYRYPYSLAGEFNWQLSAHPYVALCMDKRDRTDLRQETRPRHLEYYKRTERCTGAGPIMDAELEADDPKCVPMGSLVFFNAKNDEQARSTVENDPYNEAGLFKSIFIARFNELDLDGLHTAKAYHWDPMRDTMAVKGLVRSDEYPTEPGWKPFDNLAWLEAENEKKEKQEYMEQRRELYENRDRRLEKNMINEGATFKSGAYVYMGRRNESEWYDHWPRKLTPGNDWGEDRFSFEKSIPPVDMFEDDLD